MKRIYMDIPDDLHEKFKEVSFRNKKSLKRLVEEAVNNYIKILEERREKDERKR